MKIPVVNDVHEQLQAWNPAAGLECGRNTLLISARGNSGVTFASETIARILHEGNEVSLFVAIMPEDNTVDSDGLDEWIETSSLQPGLTPLLYIPNAMLIFRDDRLFKAMQESYNKKLSIIAAIDIDSITEDQMTGVEGLFSQVVRV